MIIPSQPSKREVVSSLSLTLYAGFNISEMFLFSFLCEGDYNMDKTQFLKDTSTPRLEQSLFSHK